MSDRMKLATKEGYLVLEINPIKSIKFLVYCLIMLSGMTAALIYALCNSDIFYNYLEIALWLIASGIIVYLQFCNFYGKVIINLNPDELTIKDEIKGFGLTRTYNVIDISNVRIAGFMEKISTSVCTEWMQLRFYDGKIAFDYKNKTYRFAANVSNQDAIKIAEKFKNFIKAVQYDK